MLLNAKYVVKDLRKK
ncbi:unnamed protein product [Larinioides sclopetarius]|uniref:Uncharacterized protein n=1 Tax=Larinioides sclopetarius TaxID=280406 RepID=A0AAV1ZC98_9ARAC